MCVCDGGLLCVCGSVQSDSYGHFHIAPRPRMGMAVWTCCAGGGVLKNTLRASYT